MNIPAWLDEVNQRSGLTYRDVVSMFGFKNHWELWRAIKSGDFPEPDKDNAGPYHHQRVWLVTTIKREIRRRNKISSNHP